MSQLLLGNKSSYEYVKTVVIEKTLKKNKCRSWSAGAATSFFTNFSSLLASIFLHPVCSWYPEILHSGFMLKGSS